MNRVRPRKISGLAGITLRVRARLSLRSRNSLAALLTLSSLAILPSVTWSEPGDILRLPFTREVCTMGGQDYPRRDPDTTCSSLSGLSLRAAAAIAGAHSPTETLDRLTHFLFEVEGFRPTYDLDSPDHLLLRGVLAGKTGHCVGLASVYLVLAEELELPIRAVATPKHLFLRWDDGKYRRNIELFQKGREVSDEDYVREQKIPKESIERGVFLADLAPKEFLAFIYQNLGVLESQRGEFEKSRRRYARALRLNPKLAAAYYNRGNDELKQKRYHKAIRDYTEALELYPTDVWALHNRGLAWKGRGKLDDAERDWKRVQEIEPGFKVPE